MKVEQESLFHAPPKAGPGLQVGIIQEQVLPG